MSTKSSSISMAGLLVVGVIIGAAVFYSSFAAAGRTLTTYSTSVVTSTATSTLTSTSTAVVTVTSTTGTTTTSVLVPPVATVSVVGVYFPAAGTNGTVTLFNSGAAPTTLVSASLAYSGLTCSLGPAASSTVNSGSTTMMFSYVGGSACPNTPGASGGSFTGTLTFASGAQLAFAGTFQ